MDLAQNIGKGRSCVICHEISCLINQGRLLDQMSKYCPFKKNFAVLFLFRGKCLLPPFYIIELK